MWQITLRKATFRTLMFLKEIRQKCLVIKYNNVHAFGVYNIWLLLR